MRVTLLAHTTLNPEVVISSAGEDGLTQGIVLDTDAYLNDKSPRYDMEIDRDAEDSDVLAEFAGRACYQSFHKPNPQTRANRDYLANILRRGHESVLEHASATFYVEGVSRALTHELIRHRHLSYSELSQRYVDLDDANAVIPPALRGEDDTELLGVMGACASSYNALVDYLMNVKGLRRKQAREAARAVMPNMTETRIVVSGNLRAWRDMLHKRHSVHADAEIREFAGLVLSELRKIAPNSFQDFPADPLY